MKASSQPAYLRLPFRLASIGSEDDLGSQKWSAGPAAVAVWLPGKWVVGGLINNQWSFAGTNNRSPVNQMLIQPFVNYNFGGGWYLTSQGERMSSSGSISTG
jgi:hypothetical protein